MSKRPTEYRSMFANTSTFSVIAISACCICTAIISLCATAGADEPFKLNAQDSVQQKQTSYPAPQMMQGRYSTVIPPVLAGTVRTQVVLPQSFLGTWDVRGQQMRIEALPEFQQSAQAAFSPSTSNIWNISGDLNNEYFLASNTGAKMPLVVDKVQGNQAFLRYAHQVGNTTAQEAVVMQLGPRGRSFTGLERISIVKDPQQPARAKVTYQLSGSRRQ